MFLFIKSLWFELLYSLLSIVGNKKFELKSLLILLVLNFLLSEMYCWLYKKFLFIFDLSIFLWKLLGIFFIFFWKFGRKFIFADVERLLLLSIVLLLFLVEFEIIFLYSFISSKLLFNKLLWLEFLFKFNKLLNEILLSLFSIMLL